MDASDEHGSTALHRTVCENEPDIYVLLAQAGSNQHIPDKSWPARTPAMAFEDEFGMTCEEKFKDMTIDAAYFRKEVEDL